MSGNNAPASAEKPAPAPFLRRAVALVLSGNTVAVTFLAFFSALVVGAVYHRPATPAAIRAWQSFGQAPGEAFLQSWRAIANAYSSLFLGSIGSPRASSQALSSGRFPTSPTPSCPSPKPSCRRPRS